ncbi:hypothetical protein [Thalassovita mediterranea]|jgi:hypothetical protein|uniref:Uncharacterized protein n=1 Tax=Thalassovita mediterranea TaxID=340021 RepID=A0A0P1H3V4_9RHOB|nr:hypothetical protein [Thalassovita mediterranea]MCG7574640.1 hypothetical protein [Phaeobacter sp. CNT1-3]CUH83617.1 hypothetical protein TM5383_00813 [Thalassovita mediterranea]SIS28849.1 hypothetical protein SAMN05421685_101700 [Thalassovita mediterranea]
MNANQLINMVIRQVMRRLVNKGVNAGLNKLGGSAKNVRNARKASRMADRLNR